MNDKIIALLSAGVPQSMVAKACGVTDGYVSQLMADENIRAQVTEAKIGDIEKGLSVDTSIESLEKLSLEKLEKLIPFMSKPRDLLAVFQAMNTAKKKTAELVGSNIGTPTAPLVQINISQAAAIAFRMDSVKQVIEVDGRSMTTLPAKLLNARLAERISTRPAITDASSAASLLDRIELGIPVQELSMVDEL